MRAPSTILQRAARVFPGCTMQPGDGELLIPPTLQNSFEIGQPLDSAAPAPSYTPRGSFWVAAERLQAGVSVGALSTVVNLLKGIWTLEMTLGFLFSGTSDATKSSIITLFDPQPAGYAIARWPSITGIFNSFSHRMRLVLVDDGWSITISTPATIAGDILQLSCSINGIRHG